MIGIDTNLLVRLWTNDDPTRVARIRAHLAPLETQAESVFINDIVLSESVWVAASLYRFDKPAILTALQALLDTAMFAFEDRATLQQAMRAWRTGRAGFADCLIVARNRRMGCQYTATCDKTLARHEGTQALP